MTLQAILQNMIEWNRGHVAMAAVLTLFLANQMCWLPALTMAGVFSTHVCLHCLSDF